MAAEAEARRIKEHARCIKEQAAAAEAEALRFKEQAVASATRAHHLRGN